MLYSQTPLPFRRAMVGSIAIGSHAAAEPLVCFLVLHEPMDVQFHCVIIKRLQLKLQKIVFDAVWVKYRKGTEIDQENYGLSAINNSLTKQLYSSISCIKKCIYSTFLVHEDEQVISRDFKQQLRMEQLHWP